MESLLLRDRLTLAAVLGAGVVIGVSGLYVYFKYTRTLSRDLNHLTQTIQHLDQEIQELKSAKIATKRSAQSSSSQEVASSTSAETPNTKLEKSKRQSSISGDSCTSHVSSNGDDNEEYYDVSEESEVHESWTTFNGEIPVICVTDDFKLEFEEIDELLRSGPSNYQSAYDRLVILKDQHEGNVGIMWRLAMACYYLSTAVAQDDKKKELTFEGLKYATIALAYDETIGEVHKWYAALLGKTTDYVGIQEKIKNGYTFKQHVDEAIKYLPDDRGLYFMKGRWCYEVSMLSWLERKAASALFATPPTSTLSEAREQFLQVERLYPKQWKENLLYIAKCYIGEKNYSECIKWLDDAFLIECKNNEDKEIQAEITSLRDKYNSYRVT